MDAMQHRIGEIFVDLGFVTQEDIDAAIEVQAMTGRRLGEILISHGKLSRLDLASALSEQWHTIPVPQAEPEPEPEPQPVGTGGPAAPAETLPAPSVEWLEAAVLQLSVAIGQLERAHRSFAATTNDRLHALELAVVGMDSASAALAAERAELQAEQERLVQLVAALERRHDELQTRRKPKKQRQSVGSRDDVAA